MPDELKPEHDIHFIVDHEDDLTELELADREGERQLEINKWRMQLAFLITVVILFLVAAAFIVDAVFQYQGRVFHPPEFFVELCRIVITAGVGILGVCTAMGIGRLKRKQNDSAGTIDTSGKDGKPVLLPKDES